MQFKPISTMYPTVKNKTFAKTTTTPYPQSGSLVKLKITHARVNLKSPWNAFPQQNWGYHCDTHPLLGAHPISSTGTMTVIRILHQEHTLHVSPELGLSLWYTPFTRSASYLQNWDHHGDTHPLLGAHPISWPSPCRKKLLMNNPYLFILYNLLS